MGYTTVRISEVTRDTLRRLAGQKGRPMQSVLEEAVESLRRQRFLEDVNSAYAELRGDSEAWRQVEQERTTWDKTLLDGLTVAEGTAPYRSGRAKRKKR